MASIRQRNEAWHVQVRRTGQPSLTRSFKEKSSAVRWARSVESEIDQRGFSPSRTILERTTVGDMLRRYRDEVAVKKRGYCAERYVIQYLLRHEISKYALASATPDVIRAYRDERLGAVKGATVLRHLTILQHAFSIAFKEWGFPLWDNPVAAITKPTASRPRVRRLEAVEEKRLLVGSALNRGTWLSTIIQLAIETGMRRGELVSISWADIDFELGTLYIPTTKNGYPRTIPLTEKAIMLLRTEPRSGEYVFPVSANALRLAWERLKKRVGVQDLRFHDLRHEAISRFFEIGLSVPEVALISGHRDPRMLFRYTHLKPEDVARKLRGISDAKPQC